MNMMNGGPPAQQMQGQGTVKKWFGEKGYGFLVPQNGGVDIFVHRRALSGIYDLNEGDTVLFDAEFEEARNKWKAYKCQLLESANPGMPGMLPPGPQPQRGGGGKRGGGRGKGGGFPMAPMDGDMLDDGMLPPMGGLGMNMGMPGGGMPGGGGFGLGKKGGNSRGGGRGGNKGGGFPLDPMDNDDMLGGMDMGMGMPGGNPRMGGNPQFGAGRKGGGGGKGYNDSPNLDNFSNMMASMGMPDGKKGGGRGRGDKGKGGKNMNGGGRGGRGGAGNQFNPNGSNKGGGKPFDLGDVGGGGNRGPGGMRGGGGGGNRGPGGLSQPPPLDQPQNPQNDHGQMQVVAELPLNWVQLRGPEGNFFVNSTTRQVTQDVPPELRQLAEQQTNLPSPLQQSPPMGGGQRLGGGGGGGGGQFPFPNQPQQFQQSPQQVGLMSQQMSPQPPLPHMMQNNPPMQQPQGNNEVTLKATLGNWLVCEDAQGVFYRDSRTGQTFDQMPPELQRMYNEQDMMGGGMPPQQVPPPMQQQNPMYQQHLQQAPYNPGQFNDYLDMPQAYEHQSM